MSELDIIIVGPREIRRLHPDVACVDTTAKSGWSAGLSPFVLGPCPMYGDRTAQVFENLWQGSKVYADQVGPDGEPSAAYWQWAERLWRDPAPHRYPRGRKSAPAYSYWDGEHLGYVDARMQIYFPVYRDAVARTPAFARLQAMAHQHGTVALFDFDGYDHDGALGMSLADVIRYDKHPMGHAVVLKCMLLYGPTVTPTDVLLDRRQPSISRNRFGRRAVGEQRNLF